MLVTLGRPLAAQLASLGLLHPPSKPPSVVLVPTRELAVELEGDQVVGIADVGILALLCQHLAAVGTKVTVKWPKDLNAPRAQFLLELGLDALLDDCPGTREGSIPQEGLAGRPSLSRRRGDRYVRLRWLRLGDFYPLGDGPPSEEPQLAPELRDAILRVLRLTGLPEPVCNSFLDEFLLELGSNVIAHSAPSPTAAAGLVAAHWNPTGAGHLPQGLHFLVADFGRGIASALTQAGRGDGASTPEDYLRAALDRTRIPADARTPYAAQSPRGLALLASSVGPGDALTLASHGTALKVEAPQGPPLLGTVEFDRLPGVLAFGVLSPVHRSRPRPVVRSQSRATLTPEAASATVVSVDVTAPALPSFPIVKQGPLVVNVGFSDTHARYITRLLMVLPSASDVILLNLRTTKEPFRLVVRTLEEQGHDLPRSLAVAFGPGDWRSYPPPSSLLSLEGGARFGVEAYVAYARKALSAMLDRGFVSTPNDHGFYAGSITLLTGEVVGRFYSLRRHIASDPAIADQWVGVVEAQLSTLLEGRFQPLTFVVCADAMRPIIEKLTRSGSDHAILLLTYDAPTIEELRPLVSRDHAVVILTDVLSTGSMVQSVVAAVRRIGAPVLGVITLVDARSAPRQFEEGDIPVLSCASFSQVAASGPRRWLDPVSLEPTRQQPLEFEPGTLERVRDSVSLLSIVPEAVACGHLVDGVRHSSVWVDLQQLSRDASFSEAIGRRLSATRASLPAEFSQFEPTRILFPVGVGRLEMLGGRGRTATYDTAAADYLPAVQAEWSGARPMRVNRSFDPLGRSRCATPLEIADKLTDVIVLDDCYSTGTTARELVDIAVRLGARRVLVLCVLSRASMTESVRLERSLHMIGPSRVLVGHRFLLLLPIPFSSSADCPYEATLARITSRSSAWAADPGLASATQELLEEIAPRSARSEAGTRRLGESLDPRLWLHLRVLAEVAGYSDEALQQLRREVDSLSPNQTALTGLSMFLEEWRVLGQARLRQALQPRVVEAATRLLTGSSGAPALYGTALSLVRSVRPDLFTQMLRVTPVRSLAHVSVSRRSLLHLASLVRSNGTSRPSPRPDWHAALDQLEAAVGAGRAPRDVSKHSEFFRSLAFVKQAHTSHEDVEEGLAASMRALRRMFRAEHVLLHNTKDFLLRLSRYDGARVTPSTRQSNWLDWQAKHSVALGRLSALIRACAPCLQVVAASIQGSPFPDDEAIYATLGNGQFEDDIATVGGTLHLLADQEKDMVGPVPALKAASGRLYMQVLEDSAILRRTLAASTITVGSIRDGFERRLNELALEHQFRVDVATVPPAARHREVLASETLAASAIDALCTNLKHAFPRLVPGGASPRDRRVYVSIVPAEGAGPIVEFTVWNDGNRVVTDARQASTAVLVQRLAQVGAQLFDACLVADHEYTVSQTVSFMSA